MTQRERQLLEWIRENPMISQQELAEKAGITRSSAAVHISSLMKKGYIAGRGYLLRTDPYIVVVGGVNMDIGAVSHAPLVARDSNPGRVTTSLGGVGRNIAHNLCLLGEQTAMVTVLGQDAFAQSVQENAADIGLDLRHSATIPGGRTGTYLFIEAHFKESGIDWLHVDNYLNKLMARGESDAMTALEQNLSTNLNEYIAESAEGYFYAMCDKNFTVTERTWLRHSSIWLA